MIPRSKPTKVLALAPGKREFGLAVFIGTELTYFSLKSFRNLRTDRIVIDEVGTLMRELVKSFDPGVIAISGISKYQQTSSILKQMRKALKNEAATSQIPFIEVTLNQILSTLSYHEKTTKKEVFLRLANIYPELAHLVNRPNHWQNQYYNNLFMAVAVGVVLSVNSVPKTIGLNQ